MLTYVWYLIWTLSEKTGIGLGRFAPFVFSQMIGRRGHIVRHKTWQYLIDWTGAMAAKYGGIVLDGTNKLDWGQAMCRESFGPNWMDDEDFKAFDNIPSDQPVPDYVVEVCRRWAAGEWPEWATATKKIRRS